MIDFMTKVYLNSIIKLGEARELLIRVNKSYFNLRGDLTDWLNNYELNLFS